MKFLQLTDSQQKSYVCEKILRSLPKWFGIESAILDYIKDVVSMETWVATESDLQSAVGFLSINKHNPSTAEIHVMGVKPEYHGKKIGYELLQTAEESLINQNFKFLSVKTLSESRPNKEYDQTRGFYLHYGFTPVEEFKTLWGPANPCLLLIKNLKENNKFFNAAKNIKLVKQFWQFISDQNWDAAETLLHKNFIADWPQSRERMTSANNYIDVNRKYPGNHKVKLIHIFNFKDKIFTTVWIEADTGQKTFANSFFELSGGKICRIEEYWAEPYSAPNWRKSLVEMY